MPAPPSRLRFPFVDGRLFLPEFKPKGAIWFPAKGMDYGRRRSSGEPYSETPDVVLGRYIVPDHRRTRWREFSRRVALNQLF